MANIACAEVAEVVVKWTQMRLFGPAFPRHASLLITLSCIKRVSQRAQLILTRQSETGTLNAFAFLQHLIQNSTLLPLKPNSSTLHRQFHNNGSSYIQISGELCGTTE